MPPKLEIQTDISEDEYETLQSPFVVIPPGESGVEQEGDYIYLRVEAGMADWKQAGISVSIPLTVTEEGINNGKVIDGLVNPAASGWYMAVSKGAMGINKNAAKAFGVEDRVMIRRDGKILLNPNGFLGASALAKFKREKSNKGNMRSVLDSTAFLPVGANPSTQAPDIT